MADLPAIWPGYIQVEETDFKAAVSEYTAKRIGEAINFLYNKNFTTVVATSNSSWLCPDGVTQVAVLACGGGGGGWGGNVTEAGNVGDEYGNLPGGFGAEGNLRFVGTTPGQVYNLLIGGGGAPGNQFATAGSGGDTHFANNASVPILTWKGASGATSAAGMTPTKIWLGTGAKFSQAGFAAGTSALGKYAGPGGALMGGGAGFFGPGGNSGNGLGVGGQPAAGNTGGGGGSGADNSGGGTGGAGGSGLLLLFYVG